MFVPEVPSATTTEINFPACATQQQGHYIAAASHLCSRATQVYSLDCCDRYWKQSQSAGNESPSGVGKQQQQLKMIVAAEERMAHGGSSPPGFHKRLPHRLAQQWPASSPPVDPYHKFSPSVLQPRSSASPAQQLAEQQQNSSGYAPPCYRVFPATNAPPMSPLAAEVYRQWSPSASPLRPWHTRAAGGGLAGRAPGGDFNGQRLAARPALGLLNATLHHVPRPLADVQTNAASAGKLAQPPNVASPSCAVPPPYVIAIAPPASVRPEQHAVAAALPPPPDPCLEQRKLFARDLQRQVVANRVNALLPDSIAKNDLEEQRVTVDMSAYAAVAFPATMAYVEAMGTLLHRIIDISYPRHRYEKQFRFDAVSVPEVAISDYLERLRCFFLCSPECFVLAMIYIDRLVRLYDGKVVLCSLNIHRILVTAVMIAAKFFDDVYYSNSFYAKIGGLSLEEMNVLESHFLHLIKYDLYVSPREYERYRHNVTLLHASSNPPPEHNSPSSKTLTASTSSSTPVHNDSPSCSSTSAKRTWPEGPLFEEPSREDPSDTITQYRMKPAVSRQPQSADDLLVSTSSTHCSTPSNNEFPSPST
eukprot:Gregarina_sp_Pseudo_9__4311@NODE_446_length_2815_cov_13_154539_g422_i0_p1_GENE_NODE_446_length_2815_cov_13_154539_g422_i0NODE_446_length_2815_cov_13_154539_g422_i0_p1_ORF_typecomplete_len590_score128_34Cyclin/PF08613_11/7_7e03Cyclin/PF08613_11/4_3e34Cyclin_N/PF00134_23/2_9e07_NODE_446_length_2815_cov_13_154539_g422_i01581927